MEQREQRPNLFGLCRVATEEDEVKEEDEIKEEDEVSCLDFAERQKRRLYYQGWRLRSVFQVPLSQTGH